MTLYVNDQPLDEREIEAEAERLRPHYEQAFAQGGETPPDGQLEQWSRENVIEKMLLRQAALRDAPPLPDEEVEKAFAKAAEQCGGEAEFLKRLGVEADGLAGIKEEMEHDLRVGHHIDTITAGVEALTEEEARQYYDDHPDEFTAPEMIRAAHIVKHPAPGVDPAQQRQELEQILMEMCSGRSFEELVAQHSDCNDAGGDLGYFPRGHMVQSFEDVVFAMEPGKVSDIFESEFGLHIAKVIDKRDPTVYPFEDLKEKITEVLGQQRKQKAIEEYVDAEKKKAVIEER